MVNNRPDYIRTVESVAAAAEVILKIIVELKGLSALQGRDAGESPSIFQLSHAAAHGGQVVSKIPREAVRDVEVRRALFEVRARTVVGLRSVRHEVFAITRIIQRLRPRIIHERRDAMPSVYAEARLQRVVVRLAG
jgi:hypothetical protein